MIDLFDIINNRRDRRINIQGIVSELDTSPYTIYEFNDLVDLLLNNKDEIDTTKFDVKQDVNFMPINPLSRGMYGSGYERIEERRIESITFEIDVHTNAQLYNEIYNKHEGFIDYFTTGAFRYDIQDELMITTDSEEEYISARINAVIDDLIINRDINRPRGMNPIYSWWDEMDRDATYDIGSYPRHDADGDVLSFMEFDQSFRPTDMTDMFSNMVLTLDNISRPVIDGEDR